MANRFRMNARNYDQPQARFALDTRPRAKTVAAAKRHRKTVSCKHNPYHDGLKEARDSGASKSRRVVLGLANNGVPHPNDVATDHRIRKQETERERREARFARLHRKLDCGLDAFERKHGKL